VETAKPSTVLACQKAHRARPRADLRSLVGADAALRLLSDSLDRLPLVF